MNGQFEEVYFWYSMRAMLCNVVHVLYRYNIVDAARPILTTIDHFEQSKSWFNKNFLKTSKTQIFVLILIWLCYYCINRHFGTFCLHTPWPIIWSKSWKKRLIWTILKKIPIIFSHSPNPCGPQKLHIIMVFFVFYWE